MKRIQITTKTGDQIAADFDAVFKTIKPIPPARPVTQADRLAPYRKAILKQRRRGLDWKQIATGMAQPPILEKVSAKALKQLFGGQDDVTLTDRKATRLAPTSTSPNVAPAANGSSAVPPPPPAPMTAKEHEQFDPLFQGLIPPIVHTKSNRRDALAYANNAVEMMRPKEVERFHALFEAELDALDETNCARYGLAPEQIAPWKRRFSPR
jgi:hypothetical protein